MRRSLADRLVVAVKLLLSGVGVERRGRLASRVRRRNRGDALGGAGEHLAGEKSPVTGDCHAVICRSPGVRFPRATRHEKHG